MTLDSTTASDLITAIIIKLTTREEEISKMNNIKMVIIKEMAINSFKIIKITKTFKFKIMKTRIIKVDSKDKTTKICRIMRIKMSKINRIIREIDRSIKVIKKMVMLIQTIRIVIITLQEMELLAHLHNTIVSNLLTTTISNNHNNSRETIKATKIKTRIRNYNQTTKTILITATQMDHLELLLGRTTITTTE